MKAFRILLALTVAVATFYSLNVLAVQNGYPDRLDFKNRHYHEHDCNHEHRRHHGFAHQNRTLIDTAAAQVYKTERIIPVK